MREAKIYTNENHLELITELGRYFSRYNYMVSERDFIKAYMWFNGVSRKEAEIAYITFCQTLQKQSYIEDFIDIYNYIIKQHDSK